VAPQSFFIPLVVSPIRARLVGNMDVAIQALSLRCWTAKSMFLHAIWLAKRDPDLHLLLTSVRINNNYTINSKLDRILSCTYIASIFEAVRLRL
jgi:hypothetical protein